MKKRLISLLLTAFMLFSTLSIPASAAEDIPAGEAYFDFEASEYLSSETDGTLEIKIYRHGSTDGEVNVAIKTADFLSVYGEDYEILIDGEPMTAVDGSAIDPSKFYYQEDSEEQLSAETAAVSNLPVNTSKQSVSTGSALRDAQAAYLNLPEQPDEAESESAATELLGELYGFLQDSRGAEGVLHFGQGEQYRSITVQLKDNQEPDGERIFLLGLLGTDAENTTVAANATTYVTISDDEDREPSVFSLEAAHTTLTGSNPTAEVTVRRTAGLQYFSTAYVSTVRETAPNEAYETLSLKAVAFAPGQETVTVSVTGLDFSEGGSFGLRLETDGTDRTKTHYLSFTLENTPDEQASDEDAALRATAAYDDSVSQAGSRAGVILGTPEYLYGAGVNNWNSLAGGFSSETNGSDDPVATIRGNDLYVYNENKNHYSMIYTNCPIDMVGVKNIRFSLFVTGKGTEKQTWVEMDSDQTFPGSTASFSHYGDHGWQEHDIPGVNGLWNVAGGKHYFKFATRCEANGNKNHADATLDWLKVQYALYSFSFQRSAEAMPSYLYDFTDPVDNAPRKVMIYRQLGTNADGSPIYSDQRLYTGPALTMKTTGGDVVSGFYTNWGYGVELVPSEPLPEGLYLKGAYFYKGNPYNSQTKSYSSNAYFAPVLTYPQNSNTIHLSLDRNFILNLMQKGAIDGPTGDTTIYVYPVYGENTAIVNFDYLGREPDESGNYSDGHYRAKIDNLELYGLDVNNYYDVFQYYGTRLPIGSVVRVGMTPAADRTAAGIRYWYWNGSDQTVWHKQGDHIVAGSTPYTEVQVTDYTKADIPVTGNLSMVPVTGAQDLTVAYSPKDFDNRPNRTLTDPDTGETVTSQDYTNAVIDYSNGLPTDASDVVGTNRNGTMTLSPVRIGDQVVLMAAPPENYYTSWVDMTGDANGDGVISPEELAAAGARRRNGTERSQNPMYVYGDILSFKIDQDNTRYYYQFLPGMQTGTTVTGKIMRQNSTLYDLANNSPAKAPLPISGAYVNVAGTVGQTNASGEYRIALEASLPSWGVVSSYYTVDGTTYNAVGYLERVSEVLLPALEQFTARSATASFDPVNAVDKNSVDGRIITVADGTLKLAAMIDYKGATVPVKAHFTIIDSEGNLSVDCDSKEGYTTTVENLGSGYTGAGGGTFRATLSFNPLADMKSGDRVFVAFEDASGHVYAPIDLGFQFYSRLSLREVVLPALGPTLTGAYTSDFVTDLIGDPLASMDFGTIKNLGQKTVSYTPDGIPVTDQTAFTWKNSVYSWNFSKEFQTRYKWKKDPSAAAKEAAAQVAATDESALNSAGETTDAGDGTQPTQTGSGFKTKGKFTFSITPTVGFQLTLSQRLQADGSAKTCFEDLILYVKCNAEVSARLVIQTPIGISVLIQGTLSGDSETGDPIVTGVYRMYVDYQDPYETEDAVPYDKDFSFFKTGNDARRHEGYIFLNPVISLRLGIGVGVAYVYGQARFAFDMDFHFTGTSTYSYGQLNISGKWGIEFLTFDVYSKDLGATNVKLFSQNTDSPFNLDGTLNSAGILNETAKAVEDAFGTGDEPFAPTLIDRSYLEDRSEWQGKAGGALRDTPTLGTVEAVLRTGVSNNQQFRIVPFGSEGQALAVFVDDAPERSAANSRAVYYTIRNKNGNWSNPQIIDDDGTLDDYPYAEDLDNGKIMIAWSSSDLIMSDDISLEDALQSLALEAAFFDTETQTMGEGFYLTHSTDLDICADLKPRIAFDCDTNEAILYYIKTEYKDLQELDDLSEAYSAVAYLLYDCTTDTWSNTGDSYTDEELVGIADPDAYRENWYGQRFLDLRLNSASGTLPLVIEADAIDCNGLGLFVYTVDWDNDQGTLDDRDVFLQTYDYAQDSFTRIIRISPETGCYADPELEESDDCAFLFYSVKDAETGSSEIRVLDIRDCLSENRLAEVTNGQNRYFVLQYEDGRPVEADVATVCHNMQDYSTVVTDDGRIYLLWTEVPDEDSGRDIFAVAWNNTDESSDDPDNSSDDEQTGPSSMWTQPVVLTGSGMDTYYTGFGAMALDGALVILSSKGSYSNPNSHGIVQIVHRPFARVELSGDLELSDPYAAEGDLLNVTATLKNVGLLQDHDGDTVTFYVNGEEAAVVVCDDFIPGGGEVQVSASVTVPAGDVEITASCNNTEASGLLLHGALMSVDNESLNYVMGRDGVLTYERSYGAVLFNDGNQDTGELKLTAVAGDTVLAETTLPSIAPKSFSDAELLIPFDETLYTLDETTGVASLDVEITVTADDAVLYRYDDTLTRQYDAEAIAALKTYAGVSDLNFTMQIGDFMLLQPTVNGEDLMVDWQRTSNPEVAWLDWSGAACAAGEGTTTLTGIVVPNWVVQELRSDGTFRQKDWSELVPGYMLRTVTATLEVSASGEPDHPVYGDANCDGIITAADAAMVLRSIVGLSILTQSGVCNADVDGDNEITAADAAQILRYVVGIINQFPAALLD